MRDRFEKTWLPEALAIGITYNEFWHYTPRQIKCIMEGYNLRKKRENKEMQLIAWTNGMYVRDALLATVGNMFNKKGAKPIEYPKEPYGWSDYDLTDEEKEEREINRILENERLWIEAGKQKGLPSNY